MANTPQTTVAIATGTQRTGDSAAQKIHATAKIAVKLSIPCAFSLFLNVLSTNTLHVVEQPPSFAIQVNVQLPIPVALIYPQLPLTYHLISIHMKNQNNYWVQPKPK